MAAAAGPAGAEMGQSLKAGRAARTESAPATEGTWSPTFGVKGLDVSKWQADVNWQTQWNLGARFAYVKATEGNYYTSSTFAAQYKGARQVGMIRGAYHFANPLASSGADQARIFVQNGGGWTADGYTLPPVLDFEANPYAGQTIDGYYQGNSCYDRSPSQLANWVREFGNTMKALTGRLPVIYTNTSWWKYCMADATGFGDYPLWTAYWPSSASNYAGPLPSSWSSYSFWQYSESGPFAGDSNVWNGDYEGLRRFASPYSVTGGIASAWAAVGGGGGKLGYPVSKEICGLIDGGCYQSFQGGSIHWSPTTGAFATWGGMRTTWASTGNEKGKLGYPTGKEICGLVNGGCYQAFQGGSIHWSPGTGAHATVGPIRSVWGTLGYEKGKLGYPAGKETCGLVNGGCSQAFQGGSIHWSPTTRAVATWGGIRTTWASLGAEKGKLGYPAGKEICGLVNGGCSQAFQGGSIHWSPGTGAFATWGGMRTAWAGTGYEKGKLGYPTGKETCGLVGGGCYQSFQGGSIHWSPGTGAFPTWGGMRTAWAGTGYEKGKLGYPTGKETCGLVGGGCYQSFKGGSIHWSPGTGAFPTWGGIRSTWAGLGYERGKLGYPTGKETCGLVNGGCYQSFKGGSIHWSPTTGAVATTGAIRTTWASLGYERGKLGYPTSNESCSSATGPCSQRFQRGTITWTAARGTAVLP
jgi:uncharacterized protein with LGFP repeats/GH25 family lysozyme M1 (1,4-beta-N-acetylmuramidase)